MAQPAKIVKRTVKLLVNLIALLCSAIVLVLVGATQTGGHPQRLVPSRLQHPHSGGCALNVGAVGVCAYAYILGGVGCALAIFVIFLTLGSCITDLDAPVILDCTIHAFGAIWWIIGVAVLGTFVARANGLRYSPTGPARYPGYRGHSGEGARIALILTTLANAVLYSLSLWTNACCCIARKSDGKHDSISMYV